ncbi:MAG: beta strand repeat-containing protein, partial [Planctomycetota bacterium]
MFDRLKEMLRRNPVRKARLAQSLTRRQRLRFEGLEERALMAFNVSLSGNDVAFTGDASNDSLVLTLGSGGVLTHNIPLAGSGLASSIDLDPTTAGVQSRAVSVITGLMIDGGAGTDAVTFSGASTSFGFTQITSGRSISVTSENLTLTSTAVNVSGGTFTASGNSFTKTGSLAWTTNSGTLSLNFPSTGISLGSGNVTSGSLSLTGGSVTGTGEWKSLAGNVSISATGNLDLPSRVSAAAADSAVGNVTVSTTGDISYQGVLTDGGAVTISGTNILSKPKVGSVFAGIATQQALPLTGSVELNPSATGTVTLNAPIDTGTLTIGTNAGITSTANLNIRDNSLSLSSNGAIALSGRVDAANVTTVSLSGATGVSTGIIVVNNANMTVTGSNVTLGTTQVGTNNLTINATGAVTIGVVRVGGTLTSSGTTFTQTAGTMFTVPMTELVLNHSGTTTFNGKVTTGKITSTGTGKIVFGSTSVWNVNLATPSMSLSAVSDVEFASGATVNLDPSTVNVENVTIYRIVETTGSMIDNGMNMTAFVPLDSEGEYTIFIPEVESLAGGGKALKIYGYVHEDITVNCGGSCTLVLGTDTTHFGPTLLVLNSSGVDITPTNTPVGLVDYLEIDGNSNSADTLTVDYANGDPLSYQGVKIPALYDGMAGTGTDTLTFVDSNGATNGSYSFDTFTSTSIDAKSGTIGAGAITATQSASTGEIGYLNLEAVTTALPIATETVTFTSGNDAVTLTQLSTLTNIRFSGTTITTLSTPKPSLQMTINGGDGTDSLTYSITSTDYQTNGASVTIDSENINQSYSLVTSGGNITYSGSGTYTGLGNSTNFNTLGGTGAGTVSINQGVINMLGGTAKGTVSLTAATTLSSLDFSTDSGNDTITAGGNISLAAVNVANAGSGTITVTSTGGTVAIPASKTLTTDGGGVSVSAAGGAVSIGAITA